jgi:nucleoside 2-deoxyribosyltransferase
LRIYIIGSLRNPQVPEVANRLRAERFEVFDDWYAAGPEADDKWREYEQQRGRTYVEALDGAAAKNVFHFDLRNLEKSDAAVLVLPAGKSGHLELGWMAGRGKLTYVLMPEEDVRWDVMYQFANRVVTSVGGLVGALHSERMRQDMLSMQALLGKLA